MREKKQVLIVIPVYNEENNLEKLFAELEKPEIKKIADCLFVNDGSADHSEEMLEASGKNYVSHIYNMGYGSALQTGYKYAVRNGYRFVIQMDADGQHDICNVERIYKLLTMEEDVDNRPDIVLGSRYLPDSTPFPTGFMKRFAMAVFKGLIRIAARKKITDPTSGLQGLDTAVIRYYAGYNHFDDKYPDANMLLQMLLLGYRVEEIPAVMHPRVSGTSMHSGLKPILYMIRMSICMIAAWGRVRVFHLDHRRA